MPPSPEAPIRFGTSGWRGILAEDFTFPRLRRVLRGVGGWLAEQGRDGEVVVAHDTRLLGERMASQAAALLREHGVTPVVARGPVPTPVAARALLRRRADAAVVFTASHNPPEYHGVKVLGHWGGGIDEAQAARIEALAAAAHDPGEPDREGDRARRVDCVAPYTRELLRRLDAEALRGARLKVTYDAMHGAGAGVLDEVLRRAGARVSVRRGEPDPRFGGEAPDPEPARLAALASAVRSARGLRLGLATDGDADRYGVVDADGRVLSATEAVALLVDHLARTGRVRRGVAVSIATGSLVERVAAEHGLALSRHPIGFKHLSRALVEGRADVAGEESGGFAWARFAHDKDGILAGCLFAEIVAATRAPLRARLAELERRHGRRCCARVALPLAPAARRSFERMLARPPARVDGDAVRDVAVGDGLRLGFDDGFLMLRVSGTEPVLRIYAEAPGARRLARRFAAGRRLLGA